MRPHDPLDLVLGDDIPENDITDLAGRRHKWARRKHASSMQRLMTPTGHLARLVMETILVSLVLLGLVGLCQRWLRLLLNAKTATDGETVIDMSLVRLLDRSRHIVPQPDAVIETEG